MKSLAPIWLSAAMLTVAAGCAGGPDSGGRHNDDALQKQFIGKSKDYLDRCAGPPASQRTEGDKEYWGYKVQAHTTHQGNRQTGTCMVDFTMSAGTIERAAVSTSGPELNSNIACERIVGACR